MNANYRRSLLLLLIFMVLSACNMASPPKDFPYELMLSYQDLPPGWERLGGSFPDELGAVSHRVAYSPQPEVSWKAISHQIAIYPDEVSAMAAYPVWEEQWFRPGWQDVPGAESSLQGINDIYRFGYHDGSIDNISFRSYRFLQLHNNMIILILANADNEFLDLDRLLQVIRSLDSKFPLDP